LTLAGLLMPWGNSQQQQSAKAPADSQMSADQQAAPSAAADALQTATQTAQAPTASDRSALRSSAVYANKVYGTRAWQLFSLATSRAAAAQNTQRTESSDLPNEEPTLISDQEDYPPYSYVYMHGTGFQPG